MPGGDKTGPMGRGPMTGRAAGLCAGYSNPGYTTPRYGQGYGRGRSQGVGRRFWHRDYNDAPFNQPSTEEEKVHIENLVNTLEDELKAAKDRLQSLSKEKKES